MAYTRISAYRKNLANFVASVVLGGLAISFISSIMFAVATGAGVNGYGDLLGVLGLFFLASSGYLYLRSQPVQLDERANWDLSLRLRVDGRPESAETPSFNDSKFLAASAYQKLLMSTGQAPDFKGFPAQDLPLPASSISIMGPPGDRLGLNDVELFASDLVDYLIIYRLSWLPQDCFTQDGKLVPRIDFYKDSDLETYQWAELEKTLPDNRFLRLAELTRDIAIKLPKDLRLTVERRPNIITKVVLQNRYVRIVITHSVIQAGRTKEHFFATVRLFFTASATSIWRPDLKALMRGRLVFPGDKYSRSVKPLLENLQAFFRPSGKVEEED